MAALALWVSACGGRSTALEPPAGAGLERRIADLRLRIAGDPRDPDLHAALARALLRAGQPGGAVRHFEEARRRDDLASADARALAALYLERGRARMALGEGAAWRDLEAAARLDAGARDAALLRESYFAGALAALRRADAPGRRAAGRLLARAERLAPGDGRLAARAPDEADVADVAAAGAWLTDGGAKRVGLETYAAYVARGGRGPDHLRRYLALHRWWYGERERPSPALLDSLVAEKFDLCGVARSPAELGCAGALVRAADNDPAAAEEIRQLAAVRGWRSADPGASGAWALVALRAWLDGRAASWEAELGARVDLAALFATEVGRASVAPHARATLLRAAGHEQDARAAFERAMEGAGRLSPEARALMVAEAAAQGREGAIDALLHAGPASPTAWRAALAFARAAEPGGAREAALCDAAPIAIAREHLRASGELGALAARFPSPDVLYALARWHDALRSSPDPRLAGGRDALETRWRRLAAGAALPAALPSALRLGVLDPHRIARAAAPAALPSALRLGVLDPHRVAGALPAGRARGAVDGLARVARAYLRDPALADRLAGELADGALAPGERGPLLVELFARLGDPARAWSWAERTSASSPDHAPYLLAAGMAAVATGDSPRADVFFVRAAGASGDAGATSLEAARGFLAAGRALPALTAARRAFDLTAPGEPEHVAAIEAAAASLDLIGRGADATALRARLPATARVAVVLPAGEPALPSSDAPGWATEVASRLAVGLIAPPEQAGRALAAVADALERAGLTELGQAARRERATLMAPAASR